MLLFYLWDMDLWSMCGIVRAALPLCSGAYAEQGAWMDQKLWVLTKRLLRMLSDMSARTKQLAARTMPATPDNDASIPFDMPMAKTSVMPLTRKAPPVILRPT